MSFVEIFTLVEKQRLQHEQAGPAAILLGPLIEYEPSTLDELKSQLTRAEMAKRTGNLEVVYTCQRSLAQCFANSKNPWLSAHFYERCLETALGVKGDSRKKEGEAHCFLGESWEKRGMALWLWTWESPIDFCVDMYVSNTMNVGKYIPRPKCSVPSRYFTCSSSLCLRVRMFFISHKIVH